MENKNIEDIIRARCDKLLHIERKNNRLIDITAGTDIIEIDTENIDYEKIYKVIKSQSGLVASTILKDSSSEKSINAVLNSNATILDWYNSNNKQKNIPSLYKLKEFSQKVLQQSGVNPLFMSLGAVKWKVTEETTYISPLIIFPIRLVVSGGKSQPVNIEFVDDDIFLNPAFLTLFQLEKGLNNTFLMIENSEDIDLEKFQIKDYFDKVEEYIKSITQDNFTINLMRNKIIISCYDTEDICMYHDIKNNFEKIIKNENILAIFEKNHPINYPKTERTIDDIDYRTQNLVLQYDNSQYKFVLKAADEHSFVIQGPPGSGKSQTIANIIADKLARGKRVLFVSSKIAALTEVYYKLPEELRRYLLRLDYEKESFGLKAVEVFKELKNSFAQKSPISSGSSITELNERELLAKKLNTLKTKLNEYDSKLFNNINLLGYSPYDLIGLICNYGNTKPLEAFSWDNILTTDLQKLNDTVDEVDTYAKNLANILKVCNNDLSLHPWRGLLDTYATSEVPYEKVKTLALNIKENVGNVVSYINDNNLDFIMDILIDDLNSIAHFSLSQELVESLYFTHNEDVEAEKAFFKEMALGAVKAKEGYKDIITFCNKEILNEELTFNLPVIEEIENNEISYKKANLISEELNNIINQDLSIFKMPMMEVVNFSNDVDKYINLYDKGFENKNKLLGVFKEEIIKEFDYKESKKLADSLLASASKDKVSALDFGAKNTLKKVRPFLLDLNTQVRGIYNALNELVAYNENKVEITKLTNPSFLELKNLSVFSIKVISYITNNYLKNDIQNEMKNHIKEYVNKLIEYINSYDKLKVVNKESFISVVKLIEEYSFVRKYISKYDDCKVKFQLRILPACFDANWETIYKEFNVIMKLRDIVGEHLRNASTGTSDISIQDSYKIFVSIVNLYKTNKDMAELLNNVKAIEYFYNQEYFSKEEVFNHKAFTLKSLDKWSTDILDEYVYNNYCTYILYKKTIKNRSILRYVTEYLSLDRVEYPIEDLSKHYQNDFYSHYLTDLLAFLKFNTNTNVRTDIEALITEFKELDAKMLKYNARRISDDLSKDVDRYVRSNDKAFDFLKGECRYRSARLLFKNNADDILALKRCFLMSPSTVSQVLQNDAYKNFDCVIFDEASQVPPEKAISIVYRAKQAIIVGDPFQMPILELFETNTYQEYYGSGDENMILSKSILDVISDNRNFNISMLESHYRSKYESLIEFSNKEFYTESLIGFPSTLLKGDNVGLTGKYCEDGYTEKGVNKGEAKVVFDIIKKHFSENNIDQVEEDSFKSLGIITFGIEQAEYIENLTKKDAPLYRKINAATNAKKCKYFVRPIDKVQGHEMDIIVISLTYGKSSNGVVSQRFGLLNRVSDEDKRGEYQFNVAVSRAKEAVVLVHSIYSKEITSKNLQLVKRYLELVEKYSGDESGSIDVSIYGGKREDANNFVKSVGDFVTEIVGDSSRIIYNYGVLPRSFTIPIAILSEDKTKVLLGIRCEQGYHDKFATKDNYINFDNVLLGRNWNLHNVYAYEWYRHNRIEKDLLKDEIKKLFQ